MKRKVEIYEKYHQGIKTGILIKTYNISRQRIHQILKEVELYQLKNANTIAQKEEEIQKIKNEKMNSKILNKTLEVNGIENGQ